MLSDVPPETADGTQAGEKTMDAAIGNERELKKIFRLFFDEAPASFRTLITSRDSSDFRETVIAAAGSGKKYVIKLADNDFTFPEKIAMWRRTAEEYRRLGYLCPRILPDAAGTFPYVEYEGHHCAAWAEEYMPLRTAEDRFSREPENKENIRAGYTEDLWTMTARVAARHFDYTRYPSAYCLFETFCPSDRTDEVLENALEWKKYADTLPGMFQSRVQRIWKLWSDNRNALQGRYRHLPSSVFQADLNPSNLLIDSGSRFAGVLDFNLCGREVFLNYLMRENYGDFDGELAAIRTALTVSAGHYSFTQAEKDLAASLFRCLKPLWYNKTEHLKSLEGDRAAIGEYLDMTEYYLTEPIEFGSYMEQKRLPDGSTRKEKKE